MHRLPNYINILFLLTADEMLWKLSEHTVRLDRFYFNQIYLRQISTEGYALYRTAKLSIMCIGINVN